MKFLKNPNLPESLIKLVAIGEGNNKILTELKLLGIDVFELKQNLNLLGSLSGHADMLMFDNGNGSFFVDSTQCEVCEIINKRGGQAETVIIPSEARYPYDVPLNAASVGKYLICNTKTVSNKILNNTQQKIIDVKQGYTKCSICVVNKDAIITDDQSIYKAANKYIDVLLISKGEILLKGFNYGFIGGATFKLNKDNLAFTGRVSEHSDADKIKSFLNNHSVNYTELTNGPLIDIGGIIPILE